MLELKKTAVAGTLESSDVQVTVAPNPGAGIALHLESIVRMQFGDAILATTRDVLRKG